MTCKCFESAQTQDLIDELLDRGYYVESFESYLKGVESIDLIEELKLRGIGTVEIELVDQLYTDALTATPEQFWKDLGKFFEDTLGKRL